MDSHFVEQNTGLPKQKFAEMNSQIRKSLVPPPWVVAKKMNDTLRYDSSVVLIRPPSRPPTISHGMWTGGLPCYTIQCLEPLMRQESICQRFPTASGLLDEQLHQQLVKEELDRELALLHVAYSDLVV